MALKIITPYLRYGKGTVYERVEIIADTEDEIKAIGPTITEYETAVQPLPGSIAYTADMSAVYLLSPSGAWTKAGV